MNEHELSNQLREINNKLSKLESVRGAMATERKDWQSNVESMLAELLGKSQSNRVAGIELAMEVTGYKLPTVYKKIKEDMPYQKKGGKLFFSEKDLRDWLITPKEPKPIVYAPNRKRRTRPNIFDKAFS